MATGSESPPSRLSQEFSGLPWLQSLESLAPAYPAIPGFLNRFYSERTAARALVRETYRKRRRGLPGRCLPGRCAMLQFLPDRVVKVSFDSPEELAAHLDEHDRDRSSYDTKEGECRLWILEDLEPAWMEVLGSRLDVDPAVFCEQMNTFNFADSQTIPTRLIPSLVDPSSWFTMRYYEFRQLGDLNAIKARTNQMTFAMNHRRIESWRDIDSSNFHQRWRHAFVRRCASFWTNQTPDRPGWDAVILVDPPYDSLRWHDSSHRDSPPACTILQDPQQYPNLKDTWDARIWNHPSSVQATRDTSTPYHGGGTTLTPRTLSLRQLPPSLLDPLRNLTSLFDEQILHWTSLANPTLIAAARHSAVESTHFLLKSLAQSWTTQCDLLSATLAQAEYWGDDHGALVTAASLLGTHTPKAEWEKRLHAMAAATGEMNALRRQLYHFETHLGLNLERLGVGGEEEEGGGEVPRVIRGARRDFLQVRARLKPMVERAAALNHTAHELAGLHTAFKGIRDGEFGVRLSLIGSVVFPMTLVATVFSMGGRFLPGEGGFWIFWAISVPLSAVLGVVLLYGRVLRVGFEQTYRDLSHGRGKSRGAGE